MTEDVDRINYDRDLVEYIDLMRVGVGKNYNGYPLRGIIFPATMTFLRSESPILNKTNKAIDGKQDTGTPREELYFGLDVEVAKELARRLHFTWRARDTSDGMDYGFRVYIYKGADGHFAYSLYLCLSAHLIFQGEDGTFNGGIGDIINGRADFTANGFFIKDYLSREVEFSTPTYSDKLCIIVRSAERVGGRRQDGLITN